MGLKDACSSVLSLEEEAVVVAFRRHTLLPLDDCLYTLQPSLPHLTRSSLHRCLQRHGISRLPDVDGDKPQRSKFKALRRQPTRRSVRVRIRLPGNWLQSSDYPNDGADRPLVFA